MHVPPVYVLMNWGNYSRRFWSVSLQCLSPLLQNTLFVIPPLRSCLAFTLWGLDSDKDRLWTSPGMLKARSVRLTEHPYMERRSRKPIAGKIKHQIKSLPFRRSVTYTGRLTFKVLMCRKQTVRHLGGKTLQTVTMLCLLSDPTASGVREYRWLLDDGCGGQRESVRRWNINLGCAGNTGH